jgi:hypothetical protein
MARKHRLAHLVLAAFALLAGPTAWAADDDAWAVSKSSGEVWVTTQGAQQVALGSDDVLKPGDTIRTGHSGRVLLSRGAETILIAPNSVIGLPAEAQGGMATTILQRAGSILLDVERRNVKHFEVETPYLAAVVKGTQFRVTVGAGSTKVDVSRGQVEVSDFKSGQIAQVTPGQTATSFASGRSGLQLSGSGSFAPIEQGRPRTPTIQRVPVPKDGLHAPREAKGSVIRTVGPTNVALANPTAAKSADQRQGAAATPKPAGIRVSSALGEVKLNVGNATHGLAHGAAPTGGRNGSQKNTIWSDTKGGVAGHGGNSGMATGTDSTSPAANSAATAAAIGSANASANFAISSGNTNGAGSNSGSGGDGGNGNNANQGNGHGNSQGNGGNYLWWLSYWAEKAHGNGNAYGVGNGHGNGNGNGNGKGNGNGNGNGKN